MKKKYKVTDLKTKTNIYINIDCADYKEYRYFMISQDSTNLFFFKTPVTDYNDYAWDHTLDFIKIHSADQFSYDYLKNMYKEQQIYMLKNNIKKIT